ncbi:hypothetical protein [Curvibacter sp. PAE-UM]|uniref:hypothetical protein n=1 Tax=Curvibacter sp. PAE-UM TaxID=1714344 RepID=UPI00070D1465|nr:hypothetical protein [Curvibacter sp. PAE-UM]KRH99720.1 hypothetical protein AO057_16810 [Curvibacter sp. PAE-UM]
MTSSKIYFPLDDLTKGGQLPLGDLLDEVLDHIWITSPGFDETTREGVIGVFIDQALSFKVPGIPALELALGSMPGGVNADIRARFLPVPRIGIELPLTLRVDASILRPLKAGTKEPDLEKKTLDVALGSVRIGFDTDGNFTIDMPTGITFPRCMIGSTGVILSVSDLRWLTPDATDLPATAPSGFNGLYFSGATVEVNDLPLGSIEMRDVYIGTGGFSGTVDWLDRSAAWVGAGNSGSFSGVAAGKIFEFKGALTKVEISIHQNALTACTIEGNIFVPYLDKVMGLSLGFDGSGAITAVAQAPTCTFVNEEHKAIAAPAGSGYILTADTSAFKLEISRVEFHAGGGGPAALSLSGRVKLKSSTYDIPAVAMKGLRIDTEGNVAVEGGWLDVEKAKSSSLKGFPFQISKIGFGAEADGRRWVGLNGGIKLAEGLPIGVSVEGLRVTWNPANGDIAFALGGIGLELKVPGTFSFSGKVAFFDTPEASGFRGTVKLKLETMKLSIDAGMMVGQTRDGTTFFFLFLEVELPAGIPLFSSGAAIYGFAGLLATNLKPNRIDGEDWYYGYYRRPPVGVTDPEKWGVQRDSFAIGLGATVGSLPDTGFAFSAKVLLVVALPGPQLLLQGKGNFIKKKPDNKTTSSEGDFEALLVLDVPAKLFQANLAAAFKIPALVEIAGGVNVAFSWAESPPPDLWHIYLGEKKPDDRRIHATLFKLFQGDSWLMVNRPGTMAQMNQLLADDAKRLGEFEMGSAIGVNLSFDFVVVKAWLNASLLGQAAISTDPQQFFGQLTLRGSAGISVLGLSVVADLLADARVKAPNPWYFAVDIEMGIKIDLLVTKLEFQVKLPLEFGDARLPLPLPVDGLVTLHSDHAKVDEAILLPSPEGSLSPLVPPDVRPLVVFRRPVQDRARFGSPGKDNVPAEDLGIRQVSYQLRHVVLLARDTGAPRLVGAAGELTVSGNRATFTGLAHSVDDVPDLTGSKITLFNASVPALPVLTISASNGDSATLSDSPPPGDYSYRLSAPRWSAAAQIVAVSDTHTGEALVTLSSSLNQTTPLRGGELKSGTSSWLILDAAAATVRIRAAGTMPVSGVATLLGPEPALLDGQWAPSGEPVSGPDSSTRLMVWARTPFAFYRHNDLSSVKGSDSFSPGYACGPQATEEATCTQFHELTPGPLVGDFSVAGIPGLADGLVAVAAGTNATRSIRLGQTGAGGGVGTITLRFNPPVESVWVTGEAMEAGSITAKLDGATIARATLLRKTSTHQFTGGIDQIEVNGMHASLTKLCFLPGWSCVHFEAQTFPQGRTGEVSYAGVKLVSDGVMTVDAGMLEVTSPMIALPLMWLEIARNFAVKGLRLMSTMGRQPIRAESELQENYQEVSLKTLPVPGLVQAVNVMLPTVGKVRFIPGTVPGSGSAGVVPVVRPGSVPIEFLPIDDVRPWRLEKIDKAQIWVNGQPAKIETLTIVFPRPVARVRVALGSNADVIAFAGNIEVTRGLANAGSVVSLYADPAQTSHMGWMDRVVVMAPSRVRVSEVCTDAGNLGWARFEQWKWSQGVQRSVESLYRSDPVLSPGNYELRVHTAAVVTGEQPYVDQKTEQARFTVGAPAGIAVGGADVLDMQGAKYPQGGPLTQFSTYVQGSMPLAGAPLWYRCYDTAVRFNESYVTRMYLDAGHELRVFVVNASGVVIRSAVRHVWGESEAELDAYTTEYIRTLNGDGTDPCATVSVGQVVRPESVTAGGGEPLEPSSLHASEIRSATAPDRTLHRFEFVTSRYFSFRHHLSAFDGICRRLPADAAGLMASMAPSERASELRRRMVAITGAVDAARAAKTLATQGAASQGYLDDAIRTREVLAQLRAELGNSSVAAFDEIWAACLGAGVPPGLPAELRVSVVRAVTASQGTDVFLLESPEPIAWGRTGITAVATTDLPLQKTNTTFAADFGRPDAGYDVEYGGILWRAGVELWVSEGQLRARAAEPMNVTLVLDRAVSVDIEICVEDGGTATLTTIPAQSAGAITQSASSTPVRMQLTAPAGATLSSLQVTGAGVSIVSCSVTKIMVPSMPLGQLRITDVRLPASAQSNDDEVLMLALETVALDGYTLRWVDAQTPGESRLYRLLPQLTLKGGQHLRLVQGQTTSTETNDVIVHSSAPATKPASTGSIYQLLDPSGKVVQEYAALPGGLSRELVAIPNLDGTRAFLVPPSTSSSLEKGHWTLSFDLAGDAGPDLDRWSVGGIAVHEQAKLRFVTM